MFLIMPKMISDLDIQALVDNELDGTQKQHVLDYVKKHDWARRRYEELQLQKTQLQSWWKNMKAH